MRRVTLLCIILIFTCTVIGYGRTATRGVLFCDSSACYVYTDTKELTAGFVAGYLGHRSAAKKIESLRALFDSLGYFTAAFSKLSGDTLDVSAGARTMVDSIRISAPVPLIADSIFKVKLPRPYDQGEIARLARQTMFALGTRGYPFATLSISLTRPAPDRGMTVVFSVRDNGRYAFSKPLFTGNIKTARRLLAHDVLYRENDTFNLSKVEASKQRLMLRPYIKNVDIGPPTVLLDAPATQKSLDKVLVPFACEDVSGLGFDGALTFQAGGPGAGGFFGIVNISLLNILHGGESAEISYNGQKNPDNSKLSVSLSKPYLFDFPVFASGDFGLEILAEKNGFLHGGLEVLTEFSASWQLGIGLLGHEVWDTAGTGSEYVGADIILSRQQDKRLAGTTSRGLVIRTGSGLAYNNGRQFDRWHVDIAGGEEVPLTARQSIAGHAVGQTLFSQPDDSIQTVELYRTGGYRSIRGYTDNEFAFKTVFYVQAEYLFYFSSEGAVYAFSDAGAGFGPHDQLNFSGATRMLSYGVGLRIPVKIGVAAIEWARNYKDSQSLGRIHVSIQNAISAALGR